MIVVRIAKDVAHYFPVRVAEWGCTIALFLWGLKATLHPENLMSSAYDGLTAWVPPQVAAWTALTMGLVRVVLLVVNGAMHGSVLARGTCVFLGLPFWIAISLSIIQSNPDSTGLATYPVFLAMDIYNFMRLIGKGNP